MRVKKSLNVEAGQRIREVREELKLTGEQLKDASETTPRFPTCVENG